jgi:hypothetical protein
LGVGKAIRAHRVPHFVQVANCGVALSRGLTLRRVPPPKPPPCRPCPQHTSSANTVMVWLGKGPAFRAATAGSSHDCTLPRKMPTNDCRDSTRVDAAATAKGPWFRFTTGATPSASTGTCSRSGVLARAVSTAAASAAPRARASNRAGPLRLPFAGPLWLGRAKKAPIEDDTPRASKPAAARTWSGSNSPHTTRASACDPATAWWCGGHAARHSSSSTAPHRRLVIHQLPGYRGKDQKSTHTKEQIGYHSMLRSRLTLPETTSTQNEKNHVGFPPSPVLLVCLCPGPQVLCGRELEGQRLRG